MGFRPFTRLDALKFATMSGMAEGLVTALGFFFGAHFVRYIASYDHWVAFALLLAVGLRMVYSAFARKSSHPSSGSPNEFHGNAKIMLMSFVTSIDSFGVGLALGISNKPIFLYAAVIALAAFGATLLGLYLARAMSSRFGSKCEVLGGLVLIALAFEMLKI